MAIIGAIGDLGILTDMAFHTQVEWTLILVDSTVALRMCTVCYTSMSYAHEVKTTCSCDQTVKIILAKSASLMQLLFW